tara:strand:- start:323 stop:859 length:537 start_codon:yes stop_codon:yes gene_type:complete
MKNFTIVLAVLVLSVVAHYTVYLQGQNGTLKQMVQMANLHAKISEEMSDEILYSNVLNLNNDNKEILTQQGKIEGVLSVMRNEEDYSVSWHDGYERGLNQTEDMLSMEYDRGYHSAMKDANAHLISPDHPIIPATPRPVVSDAIKTPSFDENVKLPETQDEVNKLNIKIENLFESEKK